MEFSQRRKFHVGIAFYHASKLALEGLFESLGQEVRSFGIRVTCVEPGGFRTDWAGRSLVRSERRISDYDAVMDPIRAYRQARHGNQLGEPSKAADAMLAILAEPSHLLLGSDALERVATKLNGMRAEMQRWAALARSTDIA